MACGCHRSYHRSVRVGDDGKEVETDAPDDLHISLSRIETVALNLMEATGRALPLLAGAPQRGGGDDLAQKELDTVMKISIENLDHISKVTLSTVECIGILQTAGNTTQQSANSRDRRLPNLDSRVNPDHGRFSSEVSPVSTTEVRRSHLELPPQQRNRANVHAVKVNPDKPKRKRTQFTDEQRGKMKAYAEHAGWTIVGQRKENIAAACKDIGNDHFIHF
jgi:ZF-HD class homeobox domain-containing protein